MLTRRTVSTLLLGGLAAGASAGRAAGRAHAPPPGAV